MQFCNQNKTKSFTCIFQEFQYLIDLLHLKTKLKNTYYYFKKMHLKTKLKNSEPSFIYSFVDKSRWLKLIQISYPLSLYQKKSHESQHEFGCLERKSIVNYFVCNILITWQYSSWLNRTLWITFYKKNWRRRAKHCTPIFISAFKRPSMISTIISQVLRSDQ